MAEPRFRPDEILGTLVRHGVDFVLIGGLAASVRGSPHVTADVDVTPAPERPNLGRLAAALRDLDARLRVEGLEEPVDWPLEERSFDQGTTWAFVTSAGFLDVVLRPDGTGGYADLQRDATAEELTDTLVVVVASLADVVRSKQAANRERDRAVLPILRRLLERQSAGGRENHASG